MKRGINRYSLIFICLLVLPIVSAEIFIEQPASSTYNIGDSFGINLTLSSGLKKTDYLSSFIVCGDQRIEIYRGAQSIQAGEQKQVNLEVGIEPDILGDIKGQCFIEASFGPDVSKSRVFEITKEISVNFNLDGVEFSPEEKVAIFGTAIKKNKRPLEGFVLVDVEGINLSANEIVKEGKFNSSFIIPDNAPGGSYVINVKAYEKSDNNVINEGSSSNVIKIKKVLRQLNLFLNNLSIIPGDNLTYTVHLYDQANTEANGDVEISISKPDKSSFVKQLIKSGVPESIFIESNYTPGYWNIEARTENLAESKLFLVEEFEKAMFLLENNTLTIKNIGNVRYNKPIQVTIGGVTDIQKIDLNVGESKKLRLNAPDGEYDIAISDGKIKENLGRTFLTGRAIGIGDFENIAFGDVGIWIWTFLIVILVIVILILLRKIMKRNYYGKTPPPKIITPIKRAEVNRFNEITQESAVGSSVMNSGTKQESSIVALKIKNLQALQRAGGNNGNPLESIDKALIRARSAGAKIYIDNDYRILVFAPLITKEKDNEVRAIMAAKEIDAILQNHNKISPNKIEYGIGMHTGDMAVESKLGNFKFASLGNTITIVKRIAEQSKGELLISEPMHRKTFGKVKVDKLEGTSYWQVKQVMDRGNYEDFIQRFISRQREVKKGI